MAVTRKTNRVVHTDNFAVGSAAPTTTKTKIADPSSGGTVDSQARTAINAIIDVLEAFGLSATS